MHNFLKPTESNHTNPEDTCGENKVLKLQRNPSWQLSLINFVPSPQTTIHMRESKSPEEHQALAQASQSSQAKPYKANGRCLTPSTSKQLWENFLYCSNPFYSFVSLPYPLYKILFDQIWNYLTVPSMPPFPSFTFSASCCFCCC